MDPPIRTGYCLSGGAITLISLWLEATPSIPVSCSIKSLGTWWCHWQHDFGVQIQADVNVTLHDVLGRSVVDSAGLNANEIG